MTVERHCPSCGRSLPRDTRIEVCPVCEFEGALRATPGVAMEESQRTSGSGRFGDYELLEEIAQGGMGVVYRARQVSLNRIVAVKMILAAQGASPAFLQRFRTEAEAVAKLQHSNIVAIHEIGEHDGRQFFSMEFVDGPNLQELTQQKPMAARQAAGYVRTVAEAIEYAHLQGVLHRDLKPSNVLISSSDQPKITDFGLAKVLTSDTELTLSGQVLGTPHYAPPEQASGKRGRVGPQSDVYGLGAILYYLLTGRPPFQAQELSEILDQVLHREPVSPRLLNPSVPRDLETICLKCLEKEPLRRYGSAHELAEDLGRYLRSETIVARPVSPPEKAWRWCRREPALASALTACVLASLLGVLGIMWQWRRAESEGVAAHRSLFDADMLLAQQAFEESNFGRVEQLLRKHDPRFSELGAEDLRGWEWRYLQGQIRSDELFTLGSHEDTVNYIAFSPNGRTLASVSHYLFANEVKLWDMASRKPIASIRAKRLARGMVVDFSADSRRMALADGKQARFFDAPDWRETATTKNYTNTVAAVMYSPDGTVLAVAETTGVLPDGAVTHFLNSTNAEEFEIIRTGSVRGIAFSPDSQIFAVMLRQLEKVVLWNWTARAVVAELPGPGPFYRHGNLVFSPDGKTLAVVIGKLNLEERRVDLWRVPEGTKIRSIEHRLADFSGAAFSQDSRFVYLSCTDQSINKYEVDTGKQVERLQGHRDEVWCIARAPDGTTLASGSRDGTIRCWPARTEASRPEMFPLPASTRQAYLAEDASALAVVTSNKTVQIWSAVNGECLTEHPLPATNIYEWSNNEWVQVAVASGGAFLAIGGGTQIQEAGVPRNLKMWDTGTMREAMEFPGLRTWASGVALSPDGKRLAASGFWGEERALVWEVHSGKIVQELSPVTNKAGLLKFSPAQHYLAVRLDENFTWGLAVGLWRLSDGHHLRVFSQPRHRIIDLAFSPDERFLATAGEDAKVCVWEIGTGTKVCELTGQLTSFTAVTWSPDGRRLIGGGQDGSLTIWDTLTRQQVGRLRAHPSRVLDVAFLADGDTLVSLSLESLRRWRAQPVGQEAGVD